jgi:transposase
MKTTTTTPTTDNLIKENEALKLEIAQLSALKIENERLKARLHWFEEQLRLSKKKQFGSTSESTGIYEQLFFFNEAETDETPLVPEPTVEKMTAPRKKKVGQRDAQLADLPEETVEYRLPANEQVCPCCHGELHEMSTEARRELTIVPARAVVVNHIRFVYACRHCQANDITTPIVTAPAPKPPIPNGVASASSIAYIMQQKYELGLPLYRQEKQLSQLGIDLSRQTMANWMTYSAKQLFAPLYMYLHAELKKTDIIQADETTVQVLHEDGKPATSNSYMWVYRTNRTATNPIVLYEYQPSREGKHPQQFLAGFTGYLQTDGYAGYHAVEGITPVGCWAHARRKFTETLDALPPKQKAKSQAGKGLQYCNAVFELERKVARLPVEERQAYWQKECATLLTTFRAWLDKMASEALPKSHFGKAITYCLNQWDALQNVAFDHRLEVSNNAAERAIKPFVIGRKNWLFSNTPKGAQASSILYSIIETAKENGLIPYAYVKFLLEQIPNLPERTPEAMANLAPWSPAIPQDCFVKKKHK